MPNHDSRSTESPSLSGYAAMAALTLSCVMLAGAWQIVSVLVAPDGLEFPRGWTDFREGRSTGALEKQFDQKLPARSALITLANAVRYLITRSGGEQVRIGKDGWLFLTEELRYDADGSTHLKARAELLGAAERGLERQGVKLIVALVPDKARVYADKLAAGRYPDYNRARYQDGLDALRAQGVVTVDLLGPLTQAAGQTEVYYRTDTHWNQNGAQAAAQAVAAVVKQSGIELEETSFSSSKDNGPVERGGDLIRLMGLADAAKVLGLRPDMEVPIVTRQSSIDSGGALFGETAVPLVLTGTSYSLRANFHGFLQQELSAKVLNGAKDGGGLLQATSAYLKDDAFRLAKPKVLLWELPERFLLTKLNEESLWLEKVGLR